MGFRPFRIEYSRFILVAVRMRRALYLVIFAVLVAATAAGVFYYRHRASAPPASKTAAGCDTPAPPPPPKPADPKLPDFLEAGCGPAAPGAANTPAAPVKK
jgi:hypothetical protein